MNSDGAIRRLSADEKLKAEEKLVPKQFAKDAAAMLDEGRVPSVAFATYARKVRASTTRKRKRKIAQASQRRNRR